jgi:hypothetical protein
MSDARTPPQEAQIGQALLTLPIGGRKLKCRRYRLEDGFELAQMVRDEWIEAFFRIKGRLPPDVGANVLAQVLTTQVTEKDRLQKSLTYEGGKFILWRCLQVPENQPPVTREDVDRWCAEDPALANVVLYESRLAQPATEGEEGADPTRHSSPPTGSPSSAASATPTA